MKIKLFLLVAIATACSCSITASAASADKNDGFKSMIRLWEVHHENDTINTQLMEAFAKYPGCCDEVWFFFDWTPGEDPASIEYKAAKLKAAAEKIRVAGIIPSAQVISVGHPEAGDVFPDDPESLKKNRMGYRPMVSNTGYAALSQVCPRDTAFAQAYSDVYAAYLKNIQPYALYLDDDLRLTFHNPVANACFCDECLKQFSERTGTNWTRESLTKALLDNKNGLRDQWVSFSQEGLAIYARIASRTIHKVCPDTRMGLQHVGFHGMLWEGWDWNKMFDAMYEETGLDPVSRPGHGHYNDWSPRGMFDKAYGISRQINRLPPYVKSIAPEIEGYIHKSTGKSPQSLCTETLLYLGLGANSMSYAIICGNNEPMEWYADNYFRYLDMYHKLFKEFVAFNKESHPAGFDSYLSRNQINREVKTFEEIACSFHGSQIVGLAPLGVPMTPESPWSTATTLDEFAIEGMSDAEVDSLLNATGVVMTKACWDKLTERNLTAKLKEEAGFGYTSASGKRIAVFDSFTTDVSGALRNQELDLFDWVAENNVYARVMSSVQACIVPRASDDGELRSLVYVNACITDQENVVLRLRNCPEGASFVWKSARGKDIRLKPVRKGDDIFVTVPFIKAWDACWLAVVPR